MCLESEHLACSVVEARAVDLVAVDPDGGVPLDVLRTAALARVPVINVSARTDVAVHLLRVCGATNLVVCPAGEPHVLDADVPDLLATTRKLLADEPFGMSPYVDGEVARYGIDDLDDSHYMAITLRDDLRARGCDRQRAARVALLAHQLATAALERPRSVGGRIFIDVASDSRTLGVSIRFDGLDAEEIEELVRACIADDVRAIGSSDLGLPSVLAWCRTVVINAAPGFSTEIIGLLPNDDDGDAARCLASLHLSVTEPLTSMVSATAVPSETIDLSDSMRQQLREAAARGGYGAVEAEVEPETSGRIQLPHAPMRRGRPLDLRHTIQAIDMAPNEERAVKAALGYLRERFVGGVAFEVGMRSVEVWAAVGTVADTAGLQRYLVRIDEASTLAFLAREAAFLQGRPDRRGNDAERALARLVSGNEGAYGQSISVAVGGRVRYVLYGCEPMVDAAQTARELEIVAEALSRALRRIDRDRIYDDLPTPSFGMG